MNVTNNSADTDGETPVITQQPELFSHEPNPRQQLAETFRTGLNAIIGFSELLARESLSANGQHDVKRVLKAARDLLGVVDQHLECPKNETGSQSGAGQRRGQTCDILYVEDDMISVILVERILEIRPKISFKHAAFGKQGIEIAKALRPKLVLLDLNLPDMDGADVLKELQSNPETAAIPVVVLSANAIGSHIERLLAAGARNYLTKPCELEQFLAVVDEWTQTEEIPARRP